MTSPQTDDTMAQSTERLSALTVSPEQRSAGDGEGEKTSCSDIVS